MTIPVLSLFSGAGGIDYAFERQGAFRIAAALELESVFCRTLEANQRSGLLTQASIVNESAGAADPYSLVRKLGIQASEFGIVGGPPCESFSVMGRHGGMNDPRGMLILTFSSWVQRLRPAFFMMENVPHLLKIDDGAAFETFLDSFQGHGYSIAHAVLRASDYGAATIRRRLFVVGLRSSISFQFPAASHHGTTDGHRRTNSSPWKTVRDAFRGLATPGQDKPGSPQGHVRIRHTDVVEARFDALREGQTDHVRKRTRLSWDLPSPSLMAGNASGARLHIHPSEPRELTNREAARLHGFPDQYTFAGNRVLVAKQIANSVPIELGGAMAAAIAAQCQ